MKAIQSTKFLILLTLTFLLIISIIQPNNLLNFSKYVIDSI